MNQIAKKQNEDRFLEMLAAQRQLYDEEKHWMGVWIIFVTLVAIIGTGLIPLINLQPAYQALITVGLFSFELICLPLITKKRENAARIQELFDCELLEMGWIDTMVKKPPQDIIVEAAQRYWRGSKEARKKPLRDWYTAEANDKPLHFARVICQAQNIWWDAKQRRTYVNWILIATVGLCILLLLIGLVRNPTLSQFFTSLLLFLPLIFLGCKHASDHYRAAQRLDELHDSARRLLDQAQEDAVNITKIEQGSRDLQNEIYHHRCQNPPVASWFYNRILKQYEKLAKTPGVISKM